MSDTPETDKEHARIISDHSIAVSNEIDRMADFSRTLETQRDEARAEVRLLRKAIADVLPGMKCQPLPKLGAWNWPWAVETLEEVLKDEVATRKSPLLTVPIVSA